MIQTENLGKKFNDFWAVDNIQLDVKAGKILALLGQNGAGKTTTIRMLTGLLRPSRGWARVNGHDVVKEASQVRSSVGVLTEQHGLYLRMTAVEYLDFFGKIYRLDADLRKKRSDYLLEYFGLAEVAKERIGKYSKGMKQKLALARTLIHEPPVLLLDEPTSAMDPESARLVRDEIASLRSSKRAIVICTHNLAEAEMLADEIAIIYRGKIRLKGTLDALKDKVLGSAEYEVCFSAPYNVSKLKIPASMEILEKTTSTLRFRTENPAKDNAFLLSELSKEDAPILTLEKTSRTLEEVYLKAMTEVNREMQ
ncbi:MAG: ABC transporter ATP-binding protein [Anaerolineae bacterium]|jgi:ABC-2 type transport system ATP-binding protein|nr:ABC transporter ATP-binding protein [Anaerolineae bacterium]MBT7075538.1 ABC transporter ATP-binding protein [Anaerolineae bacterium]MBT7782904.1 ABC transporter ATP-binding protein [Anaerolineae bacterium]